MEHPADNQHGTEPAVPTRGRALARTLPACTVAAIGIPLTTGALPVAVGSRTPWALLIILAALVLMPIVHHLTQAPRPRPDKKIDAAQRKTALDLAARTGVLPADPTVRSAAGVAACATIERFTMMVTFLLGTLVGGFIRPDLAGWWLGVGAALGGLIGYGFRLRCSWSYLQALHHASESD